MGGLQLAPVSDGGVAGKQRSGFASLILEDNAFKLFNGF